MIQRAGNLEVAATPSGERGALARALVIAAAAAGAVVAVPVLGWVGLVARIAPSVLGGAGLWLVVGIAIAIAFVATRQAPRLRATDRRAARVGYWIGAIVVVVYIAGDVSPTWRDARAYFDNALPTPYDVPYQLGGIAYPPPFAQMTAPLVALGWPAFAAIWFGATLLLIDRLLGPTAIAILLVPFVALDVANGNVNLIIAAAIVYGFRWPELLALPILTKITPAVCLVWFIARGEWRSLMRALAATTVMVLVSLIIAPHLWVAWIDTVQSSSIPPGALAVGPLLPRLVAAIVITAWGARTDRPWLVPVAVVISMPVIWPGTTSILIACVPLSRRPAGDDRRLRAVDWALMPDSRR